MGDEAVNAWLAVACGLVLGMLRSGDLKGLRGFKGPRLASLLYATYEW